jgi:adenylosuccinate lyase
MLERFAWLVEGLVVRPGRMRENLDASHGLFFSQRVLLGLVEAGLERDEAYRLVQRDAMLAWEESRDFPTIVRDDPEITARLDTQVLDSIFDVSAFTRHLDVIFDRLHALVPKEEPVHV